MNFHDDLHPPDPNQRQICKKLWTESFSHLPWGRTGHARKWIRFDDIDWGQGERMKKTLSPTVYRMSFLGVQTGQKKKEKDKKYSIHKNA